MKHSLGAAASRSGGVEPRSRRGQAPASERSRAIHRRRGRADAPESPSDRLDESLKESFPASDPPTWTIITGIGAPPRKSGLSTAHGTGEARSDLPISTILDGSQGGRPAIARY
jgi:hypothetical protein